jgi:hypothetical protein
LNLSANTGNNTADYNTGGASNIQTGNADIIANMINFVNNNIAGGGNLVVTVVNVFGSWAGNFLFPGQTDPNDPANIAAANTTTSPAPAVTGTAAAAASTNTGNTGHSSGGSSGNSGSSSGTSGSSNSSSTSIQNSNSTGIVTNQTSTVSGILQTAAVFSGYSGSGTFKQVKVAGISTSVPNTVLGKTKKVVVLNLAWAVIIAPFLMLVIYGRRAVWTKLVRKNVTTA